MPPVEFSSRYFIFHSSRQSNQCRCGPSEESHHPYMPATGKHLHETETIECGRFILPLNRLYLQGERNIPLLQ
ncbi:hypothetical protein HMPREF3039_02098 [Akkermansia sp. KLE1798]|nr:hypothetical protein HMPREF3039_02098 [Akkermansia sp. KLE1798]